MSYVMLTCLHSNFHSRVGQQGAAYIKNDEVEEDKEDVHHDPHDELQLADHPPGILQGVRQVLALLVYLVMHHTSCCKPGVVYSNDNNNSNNDNINNNNNNHDEVAFQLMMS